MNRSAWLLVLLFASACTPRDDAAQIGSAHDAPADEFEFTTVAAPKDSAHMRAWQALQRADRVEVISLDPDAYFVMPDIDLPYGSPAYTAEAARLQKAWHASRERRCRESRCVNGHFVLGATQATGIAATDLRKGMRETLTRIPNYAAACAPVFRHALSYRDGADTWELMLCFGCGQIDIARNGNWQGPGQAAGMDAEPLLDAILREAGQRLAPKEGETQPSG